MWSLKSTRARRISSPSRALPLRRCGSSRAIKISMQLHTLIPRTRNRRFTVVGRGGKRGKTSGRGGKGQTARAGHKIRPEMRDLIKKIPKRRGHGRNRSRTVREERTVYIPINLKTLEAVFGAGEKIYPATLR